MRRSIGFFFPVTIFILSATLYAQTTVPDDSDDARPPVSAKDIQIVERARQILNSPEKWNRADTRDCPENEKTFSLYCALEKATDEVGGNFAHREAAMQEARFAIDEVIAKGNQYEHRLMNYNNDPNTTFADIGKFFDVLEERIKKHLDEEAASSAPEYSRRRTLPC